MSTQAVIVSRARTPIGSFMGALSSLSATRLGAIAIQSALSRANVNADEVNEVIMGQVLPAGAGQAPARQASLGASLPSKTPCLTINKVCGSGLYSVMLARQSVLLDESQVVVAGGMESMSNAPYLLPAARTGLRMGNQSLVDSLIHDGLWDPYGQAHMGCFGDLCAEKYGFSRTDQDAFAKLSYERALHAQANGYFADEITPVSTDVKGKSVFVDTDEEPKRFASDKMAALKPAFAKTGTVTAANASKINDGAVALVVMSGEEASRRGAQPLVKIRAVATHAQDPSWFTTAPMGAIQKALGRANLHANDIDVYEINEAFSSVAMVAMKELNLSHDCVNVWGGAISLGHPIGASGGRILSTLISIMLRKNKQLGCASLCIGGGEAVAMIVERA